MDAYEIPARLREQIKLRQVGDLFPFATAGDSHQLDHTNAYLNILNGGSPGQTAIGNLALLKVFFHRIKTHGGFQCLQPRPGTLIWRTPHGYISMTDHAGTHNLGNDAYVHALWDASVQINADAEPCQSATSPTVTTPSVTTPSVDSPAVTPPPETNRANAATEDDPDYVDWLAELGPANPGTTPPSTTGTTTASLREAADPSGERAPTHCSAAWSVVAREETSPSARSSA